MQKDFWQYLQQFTPARIARGRAGHSIPTQELLKFQADHAQARDAVHSILDVATLKNQFQTNLDLPVVCLRSEVEHRSQYLQRPDLGRTLHQSSRQQLQDLTATQNDICFVITDGLSAKAIQENAFELVKSLAEKLQKMEWQIAPICLVEQGRVAIADEIGFLLNAEIVMVLIGERPGLTSPNSMGAYITLKPRVGMTDENRNCVSNIRPEGMSVPSASNKIQYLLTEIKTKKISGVNLKDNENKGFMLNGI
jgi:ethanolamine ammonia-lyase small subunit